MTNQQINHQDILTYTENKLKVLFQNDREFNLQFMIMFEFYRKKFNQNIKETYREEFKDRFFKVAKSQFFSGYFIIREYLTYDSSFISNEWLEQKEGLITEQIPELIRQISSGDYEEIIVTAETKQFTGWAIRTFENVLTLIKQASFDIACLGARQALLDERDLRNIESLEETNQGLLAPYNDLSFVSPQTYLSLSVITDEVEKWDLNWWNALNKQNTKNGEINITRIFSGDRVEDSTYLMDVYLSVELNETEYTMLLESILALFMERSKVPRENIQLNFARIEEFYIFRP